MEPRKDKNLWTDVSNSVSHNELYEWVLEYLEMVEGAENKLASLASFGAWLFKTHKKMINTDTVKRKGGVYAQVLELIAQKQLSQVEQNGVYGMFGQGVAHALMLKRGGYEDKIVNVNVDMPTFDLGGKEEPKEEQEHPEIEEFEL